MTVPTGENVGSTKASFAANFLPQFSRITSSGQFIAEIDGLRFIAIAAVALFHIHAYLITNNTYSYAFPSETFKKCVKILEGGALGVELFFVISGFVLALPFANHYLRRGKAVSLGSYYLRRVTRLEPPYILAMALCFILVILGSRGKKDYSNYVSSFVASLFYSHNFISPRDSFPLVNPVAWSLEIEIQFYVLAPVIACAFMLKKPMRRILFLAFILAQLFVPAGYAIPHRTLLDYCDLFLMGFLLADLYVSEELTEGKLEAIYLAGAIISFGVLWCVDNKFFALTIGLFYFCSFKSGVMRGMLSNRWLATIGGMCYSIYLVHWMLITTLGGQVVRKFTDSFALDFLIHGTVLGFLVLLAGAIYFRLIERPCMARDWPKRLFEILVRPFRKRAHAG